MNKQTRQSLVYTPDQHFSDHKMVQNVVIRKFEIIGEANKGVSKELRTQNHDIPWKKMAGMRNKLFHHYMGVDLKTR